jgi:enoyl-CoA hydratase
MHSYEWFAPEMLVEQRGGIRVVTLNRPAQLNAFNKRMHECMSAIWSALSDDQDARVVVFTGAGRAFSAGGDIEAFQKSIDDLDHRRWVHRQGTRLMRQMIDFHLPVIAAVNGAAIGAGANLTAMSDIVFMARDAFLADTHVAMGLVAGDGGALVWPFMMSLMKAREYLFTGERLYAEQAVELGLANHVVDGPVLEAALEFAAKLEQLPRFALQDTKRALNLQLAAMATATVPFGMAAEEASVSHDDVAQRVEAFRTRQKS